MNGNWIDYSQISWIEVSQNYDKFFLCIQDPTKFLIEDDKAWYNILIWKYPFILWLKKFVSWFVTANSFIQWFCVAFSINMVFNIDEQLRFQKHKTPAADFLINIFKYSLNTLNIL